MVLDFKLELDNCAYTSNQSFQWFVMAPEITTIRDDPLGHGICFRFTISMIWMD